MKFRVGDRVRLIPPMAFPYRDPVGMVMKIGRVWWRKGWVKVCSDLAHPSICTHWYPEAALEMVYSDAEEKILRELELP